MPGKEPRYRFATPETPGSRDPEGAVWVVERPPRFDRLSLAALVILCVSGSILVVHFGAPADRARLRRDVAVAAGDIFRLPQTIASPFRRITAALD